MIDYSPLDKLGPYCIKGKFHWTSRMSGIHFGNKFIQKNDTFKIYKNQHNLLAVLAFKILKALISTTAILFPL